MLRRHLLALDPSFRGTGWFVADLHSERPVAAGVITTEKADSKQRLTAAQDDGLRGCMIRRAISLVIHTYQPVIVVQEGQAGSQSARSASALARAQQACADAVDIYLRALPIFMTPQEVKKLTVGRHKNVSKDDMQKAAERFWKVTEAQFGAMIQASITGYVPASFWENAFDAGCVAGAAWSLPEVAAARKIV